MTSRRYLIVATILLATAAAVALSLNYVKRVENELRQAPDTSEKVTLRFFRNPKTVPAFTVSDLGGRTISAGDMKGKVVLVNFWATWCAPCRAEIPDLVALQEKYRDHLLIIGVSADAGSPDLVKRFAEEFNINYPVVMSNPELERIFTGVYALPTSFLIDREGKIVQKHVGLLSASTTELEARALAGLDVNASIEKVDDQDRLILENAAQAKEIPGVDLTKLTASRKEAALRKLNAENCTCGCGLTLAACRINDPKCEFSLPLAQNIAKEFAQN